MNFTVFNFRIPANKIDGHRDIVLEIPPLNLKFLDDTYYFWIDEFQKTITKEEKSTAKGVKQYLSYHLNILLDQITKLSNGEYIDFPIRFNDETLGVIRLFGRDEEKIDLTYLIIHSLFYAASVPSSVTGIIFEEKDIIKATGPVRIEKQELLNDVKKSITDIDNVRLYLI